MLHLSHTLVITPSILLFLTARVDGEGMIGVSEEVEDSNVKECMFPILGPEIGYCDVQS